MMFRQAHQAPEEYIQSIAASVTQNSCVCVLDWTNTCVASVLEVFEG